MIIILGDSKVILFFSLPSEASIKTITIFPALVGLNVSPLVVELLISPHKESGRVVWSKGQRVRVESKEVESYKTLHTILP